MTCTSFPFDSVDKLLFMFFEERGILHHNYQENYGQQELLKMILVRNCRGQFCKSSEDSRNQRARAGFKTKAKLAPASETTRGGQVCTL